MATSNAATTYLEKEFWTICSRMILFPLLRRVTAFMSAWQPQSTDAEGQEGHRSTG